MHCSQCRVEAVFSMDKGNPVGPSGIQSDGFNRLKWYLLYLCIVLGYHPRILIPDLDLFLSRRRRFILVFASTTSPDFVQRSSLVFSSTNFLQFLRNRNPRFVTKKLITGAKICASANDYCQDLCIHFLPVVIIDISLFPYDLRVMTIILPGIIVIIVISYLQSHQFPRILCVMTCVISVIALKSAGSRRCRRCHWRRRAGTLMPS